MKLPCLKSRVLVPVLIAVFCLFTHTAFAAEETAEASLTPVFETLYDFPLTPDSCTAGSGTVLTFEDDKPLLKATGSGGETVSVLLYTEAFDTTVLGKKGSALSLAVYIKDINGFLDSAGYFRGGSVRLSLPDIEYQWSLDDIGFVTGENTLLLNLRTAEYIYPGQEEPGTDIPEETPQTEPESPSGQPDSEPAVSQDAPAEQPGSEPAVSQDAPLMTVQPCTLEFSLKKLPSRAGSAFILRSAATVAFSSAASDKVEELPVEGEEKPDTVTLIGGFTAAVLILALVFLYAAHKSLRQRKHRKHTGKKHG